MHRMLGMLGTVPRGLTQDLLKRVRNQRYIDPLVVEKLKHIVFNGALEAYLRAETWRKWHRKRRKLN